MRSMMLLIKLMWKTEERQAALRLIIHVEIISINSTPDEDRSPKAISCTQPINSTDSNIENNFLPAFNLSFGRLSQHQPQEPQRRRSTRHKTPRTSLTHLSLIAVKFMKLEYQKRKTKGKSSGLLRLLLSLVVYLVSEQIQA